MSNFNYEKYTEIVTKINVLNDRLSKKDEENFTSFEVEDICCRLIKLSNSLRMYLVHYNG